MQEKQQSLPDQIEQARQALSLTQAEEQTAQQAAEQAAAPGNELEAQIEQQMNHYQDLRHQAKK